MCIRETCQEESLVRCHFNFVVRRQSLFLGQDEKGLRRDKAENQSLTSHDRNIE